MLVQENFTTLSGIASGLNKVRWQGDYKFTACCPAHDDRTPSFTASDVNGKILLKCFGGCSQESVIGALRDLGLWHSASQHQLERRKRAKLVEDIRSHYQIFLFGAGQIKSGQELSEADQTKLKESMAFLTEHAHG